MNEPALTGAVRHSVDRVMAFDRNDPYDREASIQFVIPPLVESREYMQSIRSFAVAEDAIAIWFLGQNGFILRGRCGPVIGIDLYLSNSCAATFSHLPFRVDRQLPVFIEPEDLNIDVFIATHSHQDHADPETIRRLRHRDGMMFVGPWDAARVFSECGVSPSRCRLIHPGELITLSEDVTLQGTFALPTDNTDLNHTGVLLTFANGITFYNTGDTAYTDRLGALLPSELDVCSICINGGFHNLSAMQAATIVKGIRPRIVIPSHYDMMVNNVGSPQMLKVALDVLNMDTEFRMMNYYEPWIYRRGGTEARRPANT